MLVVIPNVASAAASTSTTAAHGSRPAPKSTTHELGHTNFWECKARTTEILVAVNALTLHVGTPLTVNFVVRNTGSVPCNYVAPSAAAGSGSTTTLDAGPCGSVGFAVVGANRHAVWPGPAAFHCPALGFAQLQPGASVSGSGTWAETKPSGTSHVAAGRYTLVVEDHFRFPLRITG